MGDLPPLNIRINERRADSEELGGGFDVYRPFKIPGHATLECNCLTCHMLGVLPLTA